MFEPPELEDARLRAIAHIGQVFVFRGARETTLRALRWDDIGPSELTSIQEIVADHLRAVLDRLATERCNLHAAQQSSDRSNA